MKNLLSTTLFCVAFRLPTSFVDLLLLSFSPSFSPSSLQSHKESKSDIGADVHSAHEDAGKKEEAAAQIV